MHRELPTEACTLHQYFIFTDFNLTNLICIDLEISYPQFAAYLGCAAALVFSNAGAAYGTAKSSIAIANLGVVDPN